jgi:pimeloyl-ACP methyl ester carboxylesterase
MMTTTGTMLIDGAAWEYHDEGVGQVLVLIHGLGSDMSGWNRLIPLLVSRVRIIAVELPGYSLAGSEDAVFPLEKLSVSLADFLRELGATPCVLVGHSLGGAVSLVLASNFPELCEALVLIAPGGFGSELNPFVPVLATRGGSVALRLLHGKRAARSIRTLARRLETRSASTVKIRITEVMETYERLGSERARARMRRSFREGLSRNTPEQRARVSALSSDIPIQIIWGTEDLVLPPWHGNRAQAALPWSQLEMIPGAGHTPQRSATQQVADTIFNFLNRPEVVDRARALRGQARQ